METKYKPLIIALPTDFGPPIFYSPEEEFTLLLSQLLTAILAGVKDLDSEQIQFALNEIKTFMNKKWDRKAIYEGWIKSYKPNNFLGFNFGERVLNKFKKIFNIKRKNFIYPLQPVEVTSIGGLFFSKGIIKKIGYPREDFFLYAEDHEYTYRFTKKGGKIFLCSEIIIKDLDQTYFRADKSEKLHFFHKDFSETKFYYTVRNYTYFSKRFITNKIFFYGNLITYSLIQFKYIFKTSPKLFFKRYKLFLKAIKDGLNEKLGKTY